MATSSVESLSLFLDTNTFLHFPPLADRDWCAECVAKSVKLVVFMPVIHELDEKKSNPRLKDRAERAIRELKAIRAKGGAVRQAVTLVTTHHEMPREQFDDGMNPDRADDAILMHVKLYAAANPLEQVAVMTDDYGMQLKCEGRSIRVVEPPEHLRTNPDDELTKKHREVTQELARLKHQVPVPVVTVEARPFLGSEFAAAPVTLARDQKDEEIDNEIQEVRALISRHSPRSGPLARLDEVGVSARFMGVSQERIEKYQSDLGAYRQELQDYLELLHKLKEPRSLSVLVRFVLENTGSVPANAVDVEFRFPDGTHLMEEPPPGFPRPHAPEPPRFEPFADFRSAALLKNLVPGSSLDPSMFDNVQRTLLEGQVASYHVTNLRHGKPYKVTLGPLLVLYGSWTDIHPLQIRYSIHAREMAVPKVGSLTLMVQAEKR